MDDLLKKVEKLSLSDRKIDFRPGDTVLVHTRIREGDKTRLQPFQGNVIRIAGRGVGKTFTLRKKSANEVYVERVFPLHAPVLNDIKVISRGRVRRSRLYYLRGRTGKAARIREKK